MISVFKSAVYYVDASTAMCMLEKMRRYWNSVPKKQYDIHSWSPVINMLIAKVSQSSEINQLFQKKYPNLLVLATIHSIRERNRRQQARAWLSNQDEKYILVKERFQALGYARLEEVCEACGGFTINEHADENEEKGFSILECLVGELYWDFFDFRQGFPERRVICNESASYHGMATVYRKRTPILNGRGLAIRYDIGEVYLKKSIFKRDSYYDALATYVHEICHVFGGDSSNAFSQGLTVAMEILLSQSLRVEFYKEKWVEQFHE